MPAGLQVSDYDIICMKHDAVNAGAALRRVTAPVQATTQKGLRGVAFRRLPDGPNPITSKPVVMQSGTVAVGATNVPDLMGDSLGEVMRVFTLTIIGIENIAGIAVPPPINFSIYRGTAGSVSLVDYFTVTPNSWEYREQLVQVSGVNATQFEFLSLIHI